jgi:transcriptional regulator
MVDDPTEQPEAQARERHLRQMQKGSTEMLVLALLEERRRHGYEIAALIGARSGGLLQPHAASLYPLLYRLERRGLVVGRWVEKPGERRRRFYRLTPNGRKALAAHRRSWRDLFRALDEVARLDHA